MAKEMYTNVTALETTIALLEEEDVDYNLEELLTKLHKMLAQAKKPRKKSKEPSKAQVQNAAMANELVAAMQECDEPIGTDWVMEHVRYITSPQKATAVLRVAITDGRVVKTDPEKGKTRYVLA